MMANQTGTSVRTESRILFRGPLLLVCAAFDPATAWAQIVKEPGTIDIHVPAVLGGMFILLVLVFIALQRWQLRRLRASEGRFRALIEHSFDATAVLSSDGAIKYMSPAAVRLFGVPGPNKTSGKYFVWDLIHPEDLPLIRKTHQEVMEHPGNVRRISGYRLVGEGGLIRFAEAVGTNCLHVPGVDGIVVNVRDITEQKLALDQLHRAVLLQSRLNEFATSLSPLHTEEDVLWEVTRQCISVLGFEDCIIYLIDEGRGVLVQCAAYGPKNPKDREILAPIEIPLGKGIVGSVAVSRRPEIIPDTRNDPRYIVDDSARLSEITVPIMAEGKVLGVIDSEHSLAGFFTQEHLTVLISIASICADKLVRARAERELKGLNSDLERRIEARTAELRTINNQLRQSEEKFSKAFRASPIILSIARLSDGCFLDVNDAFLIAMGLRRDQVIGRSSLEIGIWKSQEDRDVFVTELRSHGNIRNREVVVLKEGKPRNLALSAELIVIGDEPCIVSVSTDVTERHQAEIELLRSLARERELSQLKSRFVATISHEFRTPLGVVLSSADILDRYWDRLPEGSRREHLSDIQQSAMEMARQMENVLVFGRSEASRLIYAPAPTDLPALCRKIIEQIATATENRCPLKMICDEGFPLIMADEALLTHVITNLLSNSVKYSAPNSLVELEFDIQSSLIVLSVRDRGIGIPEGDRESLFRPFHRGSNVGRVRGTGMGLAIVKRCIELHGGEILVQSQEGAGTVVSIHWPYVSAEENESGNKVIQIT